MINNIKEVHVAETKSDRVFIGTWRNAREFAIGENVFFACNNYNLEIFRGIITGIELTQSENPEYIYKIRVPEQIVAKDPRSPRVVQIDCETIFESLEQAKQSVLDAIEQTRRLSTEACERYFSQFEK